MKKGKKDGNTSASASSLDKRMQCHTRSTDLVHHIGYSSEKTKRDGVLWLFRLEFLIISDLRFIVIFNVFLLHYRIKEYLFILVDQLIFVKEYIFLLFAFGIY